LGGADEDDEGVMADMLTPVRGRGELIARGKSIFQSDWIRDMGECRISTLRSSNGPIGSADL
jgi:hypothetical protein